MRATARPLPLALALALMGGVVGGVHAQAPLVGPAEDWVPVVVLRSEAVVPLRPGEDEAEVVLGFARASDLEDGLPLNIGWYRVQDPASSLLDHGSSLKLALTDRGRVEVNAVVEQSGISSCASEISPLDPAACVRTGETLQALTLQTQYQLGNTQWSIGLSQAQVQGLQPWLIDVPWSAAAPLAASPLRNSVQLDGKVHTSYGTFDLGVQLSRSELPGLFGQSMQQGRFSISWLHGDLGGALSTRVQRLDSANTDFWGGIDLGLIWRTPWKGLLSIGARNLVTGGRPPAALDPEAAPLDDTEERIPYVRYEQDL